MTGIDSNIERLMKLPSQCKMDHCQNYREGSTDFCASCNQGLRKLSRDLNKPMKMPKPLKKTQVNKVSTKRAYENGRYTEARQLFLEQNPLCVACGEVATEVHHAAGRENDLLMEKKYWKPVCHSCHQLITEDSAWAIREGYSLPRNSKTLKSWANQKDSLKP